MSRISLVEKSQVTQSENLLLWECLVEFLYLFNLSVVEFVIQLWVLRVRRYVAAERSSLFGRLIETDQFILFSLPFRQLIYRESVER